MNTPDFDHSFYPDQATEETEPWTRWLVKGSLALAILMVALLAVGLFIFAWAGKQVVTEEGGVTAAADQIAHVSLLPGLQPRKALLVKYPLHKHASFCRASFSTSNRTARWCWPSSLCLTKPINSGPSSSAKGWRNHWRNRVSESERSSAGTVP